MGWTEIRTKRIFEIFSKVIQLINLLLASDARNIGGLSASVIVKFHIKLIK